MTTTKSDGTAAARAQLADLLDELCMEVAELEAEAEENYIHTKDRARILRGRFERVARMAGLDGLPEYRPERRMVKAS